MISIHKNENKNRKEGASGWLKRADLDIMNG
jgi:hypothetical protein